MMAAVTQTRSAGILPAGETAPDFVLKDQSGREVRLSDFRGRTVVLFFYPKANSMGCTAEACQFRDSYQDFSDAGADVIGISSDSVGEQNTFAQRNRLPYTLLSDPGEVVHKQFGVLRSFGGLLKGRATFIIGPDGVVRHSFQTINATAHMAPALKVVQSLASSTK
jgi:peroxiredoxin Q/BCP